MKKLLLIVVVALIWVLSYVTKEKLDTYPLDRKERMSSIITSEKSKKFMLGYSSVVADYIWIKTILYFGENYGKNDLPWFKDMLTSVTMLNPRFYPPYEFAALMIPQIDNDYTFTREIVSKGIENVAHGNERLAFNLAYIYYKQFNDYKYAADLLSYASTASYAPPFWKRFAATLYSNSGSKDMALDFLKGLYETTESPTLKEQLLQKIKEVEEGKAKIYTPKQ